MEHCQASRQYSWTWLTAGKPNTLETPVAAFAGKPESETGLQA